MSARTLSGYKLFATVNYQYKTLASKGLNTESIILLFLISWCNFTIDPGKIVIRQGVVTNSFICDVSQGFMY